MRSIIVSAIAATVVVLAASTVFAAGSSQSSFAISPPPISTPVFGVQESDIKIGGTYINMKSTDTTTLDFNMTGYGMNMTGRTSSQGIVALDYSFGLMFMAGTANSGPGLGTPMSSDVTALSMPFSFNIEVQPYKNDVFNIILFAGPALNFSTVNISSTITVQGTNYSNLITSDTFLYGFQGGAQAGFEVGPVHIDAFGMASSMQGTQTTNSTYGGSMSNEIPAYLTTSYGADITYVPWGLALSSVLQEAQQGDNNGFKTTMYTLSWSHQF